MMPWPLSIILVGSFLTILAKGVTAFLVFSKREQLKEAGAAWAKKSHPLVWAEWGFAFMLVGVSFGATNLSIRAETVTVVFVMGLIAGCAMSCFNAWEKYKFCVEMLPMLKTELKLEFTNTIFAKCAMLLSFYLVFLFSKKW